MCVCIDLNLLIDIETLIIFLSIHIQVRLCLVVYICICVRVHTHIPTGMHGSVQHSPIRHGGCLMKAECELLIMNVNFYTNYIIILTFLLSACI